jgi:hypothetical protein
VTVRRAGHGISTRALLVVGLVVALLLAGVVSFYASGSPDGLNRVAQDEGFSSTEREHAGKDGPLAGYQTRSVEDGRLGTGLAGVTGALVVLVVTGGLAFAVRRRGANATPDHPDRVQTGD